MNGIDFRNIFESLYPKDLAYEWDNVGLQIGSLNKEISTILISLDLTIEVVKEAVDKNVDLIVVHHPLIFSPLKSINTDTYLGNLIQMLIKKDISVYVAHTNFDISNYGMNNILADMLGLKDIENLEIVTENEGLGKVGYVPKTDMESYIKHVKKVFNITDAIFIGDMNKTVERVAISGGSGSSNIYNAKRMKADLYISGDLSYHHALDCKSIGLNALDVGHNIEKHFVNQLKAILESKGVTSTIIISTVDTNPYKFV